MFFFNNRLTFDHLLRQSLIRFEIYGSSLSYKIYILWLVKRTSIVCIDCRKRQTESNKNAIQILQMCVDGF